MISVAPVLLYPKQYQFTQSKAYISGFIGGRGCIAASTKINGVPVGDIKRPFWVDTLYGPMISTAPFVKGRETLFRVTLQSGQSVEVTENHQFLTIDGWRRLNQIQVGDSIAVDDKSNESTATETTLDLTGDCSLSLHQCDGLPSPKAVEIQGKLQQLHSTLDDIYAQLYSFHPSIVDSQIQRLFQLVSEFQLFLNGDESLRYLLQNLNQWLCRIHHRHIWQSQLSSGACSIGSDDHHRLTPSLETVPNHAFFDSFQSSKREHHAIEQLVYQCVQTLDATRLDPGELSASRSASFSWSPITKIESRAKAQFYDLIVPLANHYSANGILHHNSGKTWSGSYKVLTQAKANESWMSVSPDSGIIIDTTLPTFVDLARKYKKLIKFVKSPYPRVWFKTQDGGVADIIMRSGEKPDKLRGPNKAGLWIDEASVQVEDVFEIAIATLRIRGASNQCFMTMTPRGRHHWTFGRFFQPTDDYEATKLLQTDPSALLEINGAYFQRKPNTQMVQAASYENPFLPEDFASNLFSQYTADFAAQEIEGNFVDLAGTMFTRSDFQFIDANKVPRVGARVRYWDIAGSDMTGCYTCGVLMLRAPDGRFIIENVIRGQWSEKKRKDMMLATAKADALRYDNEVIIYVEQEGGSGGLDQAKQHVSLLAGFPVYRDSVSGVKYRTKDGLVLPGRGKLTRAAPFSAMVENQGVYLVRAKWNQDYLDEMIAFGHSSICDQVDASSAAFNKLAFRGGQYDYNPEKAKLDDLQSKAAQILGKVNEKKQREAGLSGKDYRSAREQYDKTAQNSRRGRR